MRPYLKLLVALVAPAVCWCVLRTDVASDVFLGARFAWVNAYGSADDLDRVTRDAELAWARESNNTELYLTGIRFQATVAELRVAGMPLEEALEAAAGVIVADRAGAEVLIDPTSYPDLKSATPTTSPTSPKHDSPAAPTDSPGGAGLEPR